MGSANSNKQAVMSFFDELKRRNVFRVGVAYLIAAWLLLQVADVVLDNIEAPTWVFQAILLLLVIGFPVAIIFAWAFELTPEGLQKEKDVDRSESVTHLTGRKLDFAIIGLMAVAILYLVLDNYVLEEAPSKTAEEVTQVAIPSVGKIMLVVLPLDNLSGDPEQEYFSDGLTEEMIAQLGGLQRDRLGVIARTSAMYYKGKNKRIDEIGRELGVDYVLEGSVRRAGNRVRITAQLIQVSDQTHLWAQSFERDLDDIFALQSEVAQRITSSLALELLPAEQARLQRTRPANSEAYEAYLKGRYHESRGGREGYLRAIGHYEEAIREDPEYALAYAALGHTYTMQVALEYIPASEGDPKFWDYTRKAAELNPNLAEVEVNSADFRFYYAWDWSGGEAGFRRAFESDPGSESVVWHYALCLHVLGRYEEAIVVLERALPLDSHSSLLNYALVAIFLDSRQYEPAIEHYRKMIGLEPNDADIYNSLGNLYGDLGRDEEAVKAYLKARSLAGDSTDQVQALRDAHKARGLRGYWRKRLEHLMEAGEDVPPLTLAYVYAGLGEKDQALAWVNDLKEAAKHKRDTPLTFAAIYAVLGEKDQALAWLEKAFEQRSPLLAWLKVKRMWDPLRDDPRFQDLLRRMNFPE